MTVPSSHVVAVRRPSQQSLSEAKSDAHPIANWRRSLIEPFWSGMAVPDTEMHSLGVGTGRARAYYMLGHRLASRALADETKATSDAAVAPMGFKPSRRKPHQLELRPVARPVSHNLSSRRVLAEWDWIPLVTDVRSGHCTRTAPASRSVH